MLINEIFEGIQGEGKTQGQYRTFIRFNNCNLRCSFCDTKYTWGKGDSQIEEIPNNLYNKFVLTGGEPCLEENWRFIKENPILNNADWIEVETNGTIYPKGFLKKINLWNISPKKECDLDFELLKNKEFLKDYIVKFVISSEEDISFLKRIQKEYNIPSDKIWIQGLTITSEINSNYIYDLCLKYKFNYSARLHCLIKKDKRGV